MELVQIQQIKPEVIFSPDNNSLDELLAGIDKNVKSLVLDVTTPQGRKEIASLALKVAKSKTALDGLGKDYVSDMKEKAKIVDNKRR